MLIATRTREPEESVALIPSDRWTHEIATSHTGYPVAKLKTDNIDDVVRAYGQRQSHTRIQVLTDPRSVDVTIDYVALIGINRDLPRAPSAADISPLPNRARLIIDDALFDTQEPPVSASNFTLTNLTGTYDILNQPINPPEDTVVGYTPTSLAATNPALDTEVVAQFDNYTSFKSLSISSDPTNFPLQRFLVHVKNSDGASGGPELETYLRQGSTDIRLLTYDQVERTEEGFLFTYFWDADELSDPTQPVKIKVVGASTGSRVPVPISLLWRATVDDLVYESVPLSGTTLWFDNSEADIQNESMLVWRPNVTIPAAAIYRMVIELSDFSSVTTTILPPGAFVGAFVYTPLGSAFVAGRLAAGDALDLPLHEIGGVNLRKSGNNQGGLIESYGGHLRANRTDLTRWEADIRAIPQSQTRVFGELERLFRDLGFILPTLWMFDDADVQASLWAIIKSWEIPDLGALIGQSTEPHYDLNIGIIETKAHSTKIDQ